jgi:hypothetical protein
LSCCVTERLIYAQQARAPGRVALRDRMLSGTKPACPPNSWLPRPASVALALSWVEIVRNRALNPRKRLCHAQPDFEVGPDEFDDLGVHPAERLDKKPLMH